MGHGLHRGRWMSVVLATVALCGLLAMHGFEATLVHPEHVHPEHAGTEHPDGARQTFAEAHVQNGTCSLDLPEVGPDLQTPYMSARLDAESVTRPGSALLDPWSIANRAVLTAHSILRL